jgi:hypothetical protein
MVTVSTNPLSKHFRQPKIYIRLPSEGTWYGDGLETTVTHEYPVLPMTAKDELRYKTPDALLNGQATVDVIQSCIPNITNAWKIPNIDLDAILIAIRIATYGEKLELTVTVPGINEERGFEVDLRTVLDQLMSVTFDNIVTVGDFSIEIQPISYKISNEISIKTFEEQRIFSLLRDTSISEQDKLSRVRSSFDKLTNINIELVKSSIVSIRYNNEDPVTNKDHISEFIDNADKDIYYGIVKHIEQQKNNFSIKPFKAVFPKEDIDNGAPEFMEIPITLDQSSFFGKGS